MTRKEIEGAILRIFQEEFEIAHPEMDVHLRDAYGFDSIDAIELLVEIEKFLGVELTIEEKKRAMDIRTIKEICDYVESLARTRSSQKTIATGVLCKEG